MCEIWIQFLNVNNANENFAKQTQITYAWMTLTKALMIKLI